ncbi:hypothetical protein ACFWC5_42665 [Streptomyces sp. NPDC060085]|uniref:hypothetical protein n=1 Tax=Streptomyces sp. NPDC060085 TaxID=3347054 RepID=UPI0036651CE0
MRKLVAAIVATLTVGGFVGLSSSPAFAEDSSWSKCSNFKPISGQSGALVRECLYGKLERYNNGTNFFPHVGDWGPQVYTTIEVKNNSDKPLLVSSVTTGFELGDGAGHWKLVSEKKKDCTGLIALTPNDYYKCTGETSRGTYTDGYGTYTNPEYFHETRAIGSITAWDYSIGRWVTTGVASPVHQASASEPDWYFCYGTDNPAC